MTMKSYPYSDLYLPPTLLHAASRIDRWAASYPGGSGHFGSSGGTVVCPMFDVVKEVEAVCLHIDGDVNTNTGEETHVSSKFWLLADGYWYPLVNDGRFTKAEFEAVKRGRKSFVVVRMSGYRNPMILAPTDRQGQRAAAQRAREALPCHSY